MTENNWQRLRRIREKIPDDFDWSEFALIIAVIWVVVIFSIVLILR